MTIKCNRKKVISFVCLVVFRLLLDWVYFNIISPAYAYSGLTDNRNTQNLIVSWGIFILFYFLMRKILYTEQEGILHVIISLLYILSFIPFTSSIYAGLTRPTFILWNSVYWIVLILVSLYTLQLPSKRLPKVILDNLEISNRFLVIVGLISLAVVVYISGRYTGFRLNFNLFAVYDLRLEAREFEMSTLSTYLFAWTKAVNTLMLAFCLINKKRLMAILYFAVQMLSFGIDGSKSTFFLPFLVLIVVKLYDRITVGKLKMLFFNAASIGTLLAIVEKILFNSVYIATLFIRRVLYVPSILNVYYFDYFTTHEPDFFRGSFLRRFGAVSPYSVDGGVSRMIGKVYYGSSTMNCNNGLLSDAISNLGYAGVFIMPIVIVFFLHILDRSTYGLDKRLVLVSGVFIAFNLISTSFMTVLITHGFLLIIILTWIMKRD